MPFTPFHWGIAILLFALFPFLDIITLLIACVIQDIEGIVVLFILRDTESFSLHGPIHSLTLAIPIGILVGLITNKTMFYIQKSLNLEITKKYNYSLKSSIISGVIGTTSHTILDSALYRELPLFWPKTENNLLNIFPSYQLCIIAFLLGILLLIVQYFRKVIKVNYNKQNKKEY